MYTGSNYSSACSVLVFMIMFVFIQPAFSQRMNHGASQRSFGGGGGRQQHSAANMNRSPQTSTAQRNTSRMENTQSYEAKSANSNTINGGSVKSPDRNIQKKRDANQNLPGATDRTANNNRNVDNRVNNDHTNVKNKGNTRNNNNTNISGNTVNINVDKSRDVNVINNRNTVVRHNNIATYHRPPYVYGGRRYYSYHPYRYHPYTPYYWGPTWHPWGFFIAALAVTAIAVSVANTTYQYDQGVWYTQSGNGYTVVQAPVGGTVTTIPSGNQPVVVNNVTNYYYGGAYYEKTGDGYKVVAPPAGAIVENLPEGGEEVKIGDQTYVKVGETYYQPVNVDGKNKYEVVQIEQGEK